jgi:hypothetical protein
LAGYCVNHIPLYRLRVSGVQCGDHLPGRSWPRCGPSVARCSRAWKVGLRRPLSCRATALVWLSCGVGRGQSCPRQVSTTQKRLPSGSARTTKSGSSGYRSPVDPLGAKRDQPLDLLSLLCGVVRGQVQAHPRLLLHGRGAHLQRQLRAGAAGRRQHCPVPAGPALAQPVAQRLAPEVHGSPHVGDAKHDHSQAQHAVILAVSAAVGNQPPRTPAR